MAIFSLNEVRTEQIKNVANNNFDSWPESATYGYIGGGFRSSFPPSLLSSIERIDLSNETLANSGKNLSQQIHFLSSVSNSNYGYFGGGFNAPPSTSDVSTIDRLDFSNETVSTPGPDLSQARGYISAVANSSYGYFVGGFAPPYVNTIDRLDFSSETVSLPGNNLTLGTGFITTASSSNYGYLAGGYTFPPAVLRSYIQRLDFSVETVETTSGNLTQAKYGAGGVFNSNYGYFGGGITPTVISTIDRLDFITETASSPDSDLTQARRYISGVSNSIYGYFVGGSFTPSPLPATSRNTIDRIDFSNETVSLPGNNLTEDRSEHTSISAVQSQRPKGSKSYGYFVGGVQQPSPTAIPSIVSIIDRLDFSNETTSLPGNDLPQVRSTLAMTTSPSYGYIIGGNQPTTLSTIDRLDFFNETVSTPGNNLTKERSAHTSVSNSSYGYIVGGLVANTSPPPPSVDTSVIERLDFSNETTSLLSGSYLPQGRNNLTQTTNPSYGYFGGGIAPGVTFTSTIDRLDFSNETTLTPGNNLSLVRSSLASVSGSSYGYYAGGQAPSASEKSQIDRIDFSNETVSLLGNLPDERKQFAAVSSSFYGYFGGGRDSALSSQFTSTISRLDFTTETPSNAPNFPSRRANWAATSN